MLRRLMIASHASPPGVVTSWDPAAKSPALILSNGNKTVGKSTNTGGSLVRSISAKSSGKWCLPLFIDKFNVTGGTAIDFGLATSGASLESYVGSSGESWGYDSHAGDFYHSGKKNSYGAQYRTGDVVELLYDASAGSLMYTVNGNVQASGTPAAVGLSGSLFAAVSIDRSTDIVTAISAMSSYAVANNYALWS